MTVHDVVIEENLSTGGHDVWIVSRTGGEAFVLRSGGYWDEAPDGARPDATIRLPRGALDALVASALNVRPRAEAVEEVLRDALEDARGTRNRLFDILAESRGRVERAGEVPR